MYRLQIQVAYFVKNIGGKNLRRNSACEVLDAFASIPTLNGSIVAVRFCIALFKKRKPSLLRMLALSKIKSAAVGLVYSAIGFFRIGTLKLVKENPFPVLLIVVRFGEIELKNKVNICNHQDV
jgi:hypothetical protein